ncbi:hypothetical protein [Kingella oralis]|jgi:hypothetical protein|uniref:hypothetical protein n=1 Tax=Kingella oralis TaxID=505 RepID=UPI002D7E2E4E|nr:hypothetical protein [Kingella oralis]
MSTNELIFEVMVMEIDILEKVVEQYNKKKGTNFEIIEKFEDELSAVVLKVSKYAIEDIFYLGQSLSDMQYYLREKGEFYF